MVMNNKIKVEVVYADPHVQRCLLITLENNCTVEAVIQASGILNIFSHIDLTKQQVGIFGKLCQLNNIVKNGDRVEIYRPLIINPKEARRVKAMKNKQI